MIIIPSAVHSVLSQLTSSTGIPHTSILTSSPQSGGSVISYHSISPSEIQELYPKPYLPGLEPTESDDEENGEGGDEEEMRVGVYAALAVGTWNERSSSQADTTEPLALETEVGRISVASIAKGRFLLILVGTDVSPWKVLDKKARVAAQYLSEPLSKITV